MKPLDIIKKYYTEGSDLYNILLTHSLSVAERAKEIALMHPEWALDERFVYEAALVHDIGVVLTDAPKIRCFGEYPYICHGYLGAEIMRKEGFEKHALVCERHTGMGLTREWILRKKIPIPPQDMLPETLEEKLVCFSDKFFSKSKPGRVKTIKQIEKQLSKHGDGSASRFEEMVKLFLG
ncbi:MAG: HD domain-containing protein [Dysgonamonadaceae bacterium]|jgi:uncharacterized protein|nr:HD domain-containing protein [Dysgonamonadaceae bacterium]